MLAHRLHPFSGDCPYSRLEVGFRPTSAENLARPRRREDQEPKGEARNLTASIRFAKVRKERGHLDIWHRGMMAGLRCLLWQRFRENSIDWIFSRPITGGSRHVEDHSEPLSQTPSRFRLGQPNWHERLQNIRNVDQVNARGANSGRRRLAALKAIAPNASCSSTRRNGRREQIGPHLQMWGLSGSCAFHRADRRRPWLSRGVSERLHERQPGRRNRRHQAHSPFACRSLRGGEPTRLPIRFDKKVQARTIEMPTRLALADQGRDLLDIQIITRMTTPALANHCPFPLSFPHSNGAQVDNNAR